MAQKTQAKLNRAALAERPDDEDAEPIRRLQRRPWEGCELRYGDAPWAIRAWYPDVVSGKIVEVQRRYESTVDPMSDGTMERGNGVTFKVEELSSVGTELRLDKGAVEQVFRLSTSEDITLLEAAIKTIGEENLIPSWIAKARRAPEIYAAPPREGR